MTGECLQWAVPVLQYPAAKPAVTMHNYNAGDGDLLLGQVLQLDDFPIFPVQYHVSVHFLSTLLHNFILYPLAMLRGPT